MTEIREPRRLSTNDVVLLSYARHMAETARTASAKHMFEVYVKHEQQRLRAKEACRNAGRQP
jgi:hypothetical protein